MCTIGSLNMYYLHCTSVLGSVRITWTHTSQSQQHCPKQSKGKPLPLPFFEHVFPVCSSWQRVGHCSKTWPDFSGAAAKSGTLPAFMTVASVKLIPTHKMPFNYNDWLVPWWISTLVCGPVTCWHFIQLDPDNTWIATCSGIPVPFQPPANLQSCKAAQCFGTLKTSFQNQQRSLWHAYQCCFFPFLLELDKLLHPLPFLFEISYPNVHVLQKYHQFLSFSIWKQTYFSWMQAGCFSSFF